MAYGSCRIRQRPRYIGNNGMNIVDETTIPKSDNLPLLAGEGWGEGMKFNSPHPTLPSKGEPVYGTLR